jgi:hypothetical protein
LSAGGMSKKAATEDFYFLQALAKYTPIYHIADILVYPSARCEKRVHLGTGFRMLEYKKQQSFKNFEFSSNSYKMLKVFINLVVQSTHENYKNIDLKLNQKLDKQSYAFIKKNKFKIFWKHIRFNNISQKQKILFFNQWFDAFKTIKFLRQLSPNK